MFKKHCDITNNISKMKCLPNINFPKFWLKLRLIVPSIIFAVACILKRYVENFSARVLQMFYTPLPTHFKIKDRPCKEKSLETPLKIKITYKKYYQPGKIEVLNVLVVITLCYVYYSCYAYCTCSFATFATLAALYHLLPLLPLGIFFFNENPMKMR